MKAIPYTSFNGNCEEAVTFYQSILGGDMEITRFTDIPDEAGIPIGDDWKNKVMHCSLTFKDGNVIYFGDSWENNQVVIGTNATVHLVVDSESEVRGIVEKLSVGGQVIMPADKSFWGSIYGNIIDKFGVQWGVEYAVEQTA